MEVGVPVGEVVGDAVAVGLAVGVGDDVGVIVGVAVAVGVGRVKDSEQVSGAASFTLTVAEFDSSTPVVVFCLTRTLKARE